MNAAFPADVLAFGRSARGRLEGLGAVRFAIEAELEPSLRGKVIDALDELGVFELKIHDEHDELLAAAEICRVAGNLGLPYPIVERITSRLDGFLALIDDKNPRVDHGDLEGIWVGSTLEGKAWELASRTKRKAKLGAFVAVGELGAAVEGICADDISRHLVLGSWRILGTIQTALEQVTQHVCDRRQFGKPLADFQAVQFAVADATVSVRGLAALATYTTCRLATGTEQTRSADALALRLHAMDVARSVMRGCHQLLGAIGFCDEHDVSVLDRHLQPLIRVPFASELMAERLFAAVKRDDFETLFSAAG